MQPIFTEDLQNKMQLAPSLYFKHKASHSVFHLNPSQIAVAKIKQFYNLYITKLAKDGLKTVF